MTFTIGSWAIPLFITIASFTISIMKSPKKGGDYDFGSPIIGLIFVLAATIVSLISWLIWALL